LIADLSCYATLVFDCDGVLLDSNRVKTDAFYTAALPWGTDAAEALVDYHVRNGGVSRYEKFAYFVEFILPVEAPDAPDRSGDVVMATLLASYAKAVRKGLESCNVARGLSALRKSTSGAGWMIVSGGDQKELRDVFAKRRLSHLFDAGIYGSPRSKFDIFADLARSGRLALPAVFFGDSELDYEAAKKNDIDFVFVSGWTEMPEWQQFLRLHRIPAVDSLQCLVETLTHERTGVETYRGWEKS
jgi:phosphoglycolate phosphatase-like HAD superfamily hydrolase